MKILQLNAENFKRLKAIEIVPKGALVQITGRNESGKSSTLDAIMCALAGADSLPAMPIRTGEQRAVIRLDLGDIIVERKFAEGRDSTITVESAEGARFGSPQRMLDGLLGALTFDPLEFAAQKPADQFETLKAIAKLEVDVDQLDGLNKRDFDKRTDLNRDAKAKRAQADGISVRPGLPEAPLDTAALMSAITDAAKVNAEIETRKARRDDVVRNIASLTADAVRWRDHAKKLRSEADTADKMADDAAASAASQQKRLDEAEPLPEPVNVDEKRKQFETAEATNREIERRDRKRAIVDEAEALEEDAEDLTVAIDARKAEKANAIANAKMPVEGLTFGEDKTVLYNGVPLAQASTAVQIRVSLAIAMAANPKLRVIRIKEGSFLDEDNLALIAKMATEADYQVWLEKVDSTGKVGVYIEDGQVKAIDGAAPPPPKPAKQPRAPGRSADKAEAGKPAKPEPAKPTETLL